MNFKRLGKKLGRAGAKMLLAKVGITPSTPDVVIVGFSDEAEDQIAEAAAEGMIAAMTEMQEREERRAGADADERGRGLQIPRMGYK